jgi:hypothetical protein
MGNWLYTENMYIEHLALGLARVGQLALYGEHVAMRLARDGQLAL